MIANRFLRKLKEWKKMLPVLSRDCHATVTPNHATELELDLELELEKEVVVDITKLRNMEVEG